ncbi:DinB family protein [Flexithrix dorotheae]|uniref:DinB family protein n=1 Tax=Flexithrix dorotheae TaxID=70993 RepID=UPI000381F0C0|nr:DinB family protein [Flexithrix dorotheae]
MRLFLIFIFFIASQLAYGQRDDYFSRQYVPMWQRAMEYTLEVAEAMPEEYYNYRPKPEMLSFSQQMTHLVKNLYWLNSTYVKGEVNPLKDDDLEGKTKEEIEKLLEDAFDYVLQTAMAIQDKESRAPVKFAGEIMNKERIFYLMRDHMSHHRGQCIIYLRMNNIRPPLYRGW